MRIKMELTLLTLFLCACTATTHSVEPSKMGQSTSSSSMEAVLDQPADIEVETISSVDWVADLSDVLNLDDPNAKAAGIKDRLEPIKVYAHVIKHPKYGYFLVDTGVSEKLLNDPSSVGVNWLVAQKVHLDKMKKNKSTEQILMGLPEKITGIFLTHLHPDHISGMPAISKDTPIYVGKGEVQTQELENLFLQGTVDGLLSGKATLQEWKFESDPQKKWAGVVDIFGDQSVFAISVPGHTAGSTAYLVRTKTKPVLLTGDACHTRWGWDNTVEPGNSSVDKNLTRESLRALKDLVGRHPNIEVRLGHQQ